MTTEAEFYLAELQRVRESLARWEQVGMELDRLEDPDWKLVRAMREAQVDYLEQLLKKTAS